MRTTTPMKFRISSEYGTMEEIRDGRFHNGIDLAVPKGTELHSITSGTVERIVNHGTENIGKGVIIRTEQGDLHVYGHMDNISVHKGDVIQAGDFIGLSGNSGHSTGAHLHFGLIKEGNFVDPSNLVADLQHYTGTINQHAFSLNDLSNVAITKQSTLPFFDNTTSIILFSFVVGALVIVDYILNRREIKSYG
ncbi:M23 family metallopeptidase [Paenibacillus sp. Marseille-Q4541]|uniref:M23 family metallopeptidase n=1 Tax=Paenibacillus sp. Marseille-Q4541 TaxID=2831522 RepID=UPI001BA812E1|nr:M23 family metallopeptidase [Paenibacillus sp. Marseille-Q4541]